MIKYRTQRWTGGRWAASVGYVQPYCQYWTQVGVYDTRIEAQAAGRAAVRANEAS